MTKGQKMIAINRDTHMRLIRVKGLMEYETGELHFLDEVLNKLIDSYQLKHKGREDSEGT